MIVDFHCHSTASDGTFEPREIAAKAREGGFRALALTDHDNADGVEELKSCERADGPRFIRGVELSIEPGKGFDKFHLLALGVDPANAELQAFLKRILEGRNGRNERIFGNFHRLGIEITEEGVAEYAKGDIVARPHFARWLVAHGYATSVVDAFAKYLLPESPKATRCYEERYHPAQEEAFRVVHAAGGIAVMAHPRYWKSEWSRFDVPGSPVAAGPDYALCERELARLKEAGLDGLEALYQANTQGENVEFTRLATKLGLLKSAGSDFHGLNKPTIPLGMEVSENFIGPLLERLMA